MKSSTFELGLTKKKIVGATFSLFTMFWYRALYFSPTWPAAMQIETKESFNLRKKFNSHRIGLSHQHGRRLIVLTNQYGGRDVLQIVVL